MRQILWQRATMNEDDIALFQLRGRLCEQAAQAKCVLEWSVCNVQEQVMGRCDLYVTE